MVDILLLRSALLILLVFYLKCTALRVPLYRQIAQNNVKSGSSVYRVKGELQRFAASTYIELVPPTPKNRLAPLFQPPPERYSSQEWLKSILSIHKSMILRRIAPHLGFTMLWTALLTILSFFGNFVPVITDFNIWFQMGGVLSLLLVFRTNSAYDRFWEARRELGRVVHLSRAIGRVSSRCCIDSEIKERIRLILTAFPRFLIAHLEGDYTLAAEIASVVGLRSVDTRQIVSSRNRPFRCVQLLGEILYEELDDSADSGPDKSMIGSHVDDLIGVIGNCERIVGCPVPLAYSRHTSRFLSFFTLSLPLVLIPQLGWNTIGLHLLSSWAMYGIDEIGHVIENPFDSEVSQDLLGLTTIYNAIESDAQDALSFVFLKTREDDNGEEDIEREEGGAGDDKIDGSEGIVAETDPTEPPPFVG